MNPRDPIWYRHRGNGVSERGYVVENLGRREYKQSIRGVEARGTITELLLVQVLDQEGNKGPIFEAPSVWCFPREETLIDSELGEALELLRRTVKDE